MESYNKLKEIFKYDFNNENILKEALNMNELLYLNGKSYIEFYIKNYLLKEFCFYDNELSYFDDSIINDLINKLISDDFYLKRLNKIGLNEIIDKASVKLFLSIIGGIILDSNNYEILNLLNLDEEILINLNLEINYYNFVNSWSKNKNKEETKYELIFNGEYKAVLKIKQIDKIFEYSSKNKLISIIEVYKEAYNYILNNNLVLKIKDIIGLPSIENAVNQLQDLFVKGFINEPIYKINLKGSVNGVDIWRCRCLVEGYRESFSADDSSKKAAKRNAAYEMLKYIIEHE